MADNILRSFLVSLSYKIQGGEERKFVESLEKATLKANILSAALIEAAKAVARAVAEMATGFESLYYASQRTGASVQNLKAVSYAVSQLGGSYSGAFNSVEAFAKQMRANPGYGALVRSLGVATSLGGKVRDTVDVLGDLGKVFAGQRYEIGLAYASALGLDEATFRALRDQPEALKKYKEEYASFAKTVGLNNQEAAETSKDFMQSLRSLGTFVTTVAEKLLSDLAPALKGVIDGFLAWAAAHPEQIHEILTKITDAAKWLGEQLKDLVLNGIDYFSQFQDKLAEWTKEGSVLDTLSKVAGAVERIVKAIISAITWLHDLDRATEMKGLKDIAAWLGWIDKKTDTSAGLAGIGAIDQATSGYAGVNPSAAGTAKSGGVWNRVKRFFGGSNSGGTAPASGDSTTSGGAGGGRFDSLKALIQAGESGSKKYDSVYGNGKYGWPEKPVTQMTVREVLAYQARMKAQVGSPAFPVGRAQFVRSTLAGLAKEHNALDQVMTPELQEKFFDSLIARRGRSVGGLRAEWESLNRVSPDKILSAYDRVGSAPSIRKGMSRISDEQAYAADDGAFNRTSKALGKYDFSARQGLDAGVPLGINNNNDNSRSSSLSFNPKTEINIMGGGDPAAIGAAVAGQQSGVNSAALRNAKTAIR